MQTACLVNELEHKYEYEATVFGVEIYICRHCGNEHNDFIDAQP